MSEVVDLTGEALCAICLEMMPLSEKPAGGVKFKGRPDGTTVLGCGHGFHTQCFEEQKKTMSNCSLCRYQFQDPIAQKIVGRLVPFSKRFGLQIPVNISILVDHVTNEPIRPDGEFVFIFFQGNLIPIRFSQIPRFIRMQPAELISRVEPPEVFASFTFEVRSRNRLREEATRPQATQASPAAPQEPAAERPNKRQRAS